MRIIFRGQGIERRISDVERVVGKIVNQVKRNIPHLFKLCSFSLLLCREKVIECRQCEFALSFCHPKAPLLQIQRMPMPPCCSAHKHKCLYPWNLPLFMKSSIPTTHLNRFTVIQLYSALTAVQRQGLLKLLKSSISRYTNDSVKGLIKARFI